MPHAREQPDLIAQRLAVRGKARGARGRKP